MKSIIRIKKINGKEYWYEDIPYYDKEKKQIRHRSKYIGKNVNGSPVKMRSDIPSVPHASYNYGEFIPLLSTIKELHIDDYLDDLLNENDKRMVLAISLSRIVRPTAMHNIKIWYEGSFLSREFPELPLTSQRISDLLARIGESNVPSVFMGKMVSSLGTKSILMYDITSFSSYSRLINLLEYGYSRDDPELPQINLSMIIDKNKGIPVMYDIYPGSIVDVSTLKNTIKKVESCGIQDYTLVMDRGFFSQTNLEELLSEELSFIIPATMALKEVKELMSTVQKSIEDPNNLKKFNKSPIFVKPVVLALQNSRIRGYCYYDQKREQTEKEVFYTRLYDAIEKLRGMKIPKWRNPEGVFREQAKSLSKYLTWKQIDDHFEIGVMKNSVTQRINKMGKYFIFYNGDLDWMECLSIYRERDAIEKAFRSLKHDIEAIPLNTNKENTTRGFIFVCFIALIIRMRLLNLMKEKELIKEYTVERLLLELEKIKQIELTNGNVLLTELTKKHKKILDDLKLCA